MNAFRAHVGMSLRLHFRNKMALLYGYLFPLIFLAAFWVLYRYDKVPLLRHHLGRQIPWQYQHIVKIVLHQF